MYERAQYFAQQNSKIKVIKVLLLSGFYPHKYHMLILFSGWKLNLSVNRTNIFNHLLACMIFNTAHYPSNFQKGIIKKFCLNKNQTRLHKIINYFSTLGILLQNVIHFTNKHMEFFIFE